MLYALVILVHVVACLLLIAVILLQAGRGGGLSETFGGDSQKTFFGTKANVFLARATVTAACLFLATSLLLGVLTSRRGKSIIALQGQEMPQTQTPSSQQAQPQTDIPYVPPPPIEPKSAQEESQNTIMPEAEPISIDEPGGPSLD